MGQKPKLPPNAVISPTVSARMKRIRGKNTSPELIVRRLAHNLGYRFRLHRRDLPGSPDVAFPARRKAIWVHGCFWHRHSCSIGQREVRTHSDYWNAKFERTRRRDARKDAELHQLGWRSLVLWECEVANRAVLCRRLAEFLGPPKTGEK